MKPYGYNRFIGQLRILWQELARCGPAFFFFNYFILKNSRFTLCQASPSVNILHNYSTISKPGNWHWCNPQSSFRFHQLYMQVHVCVCVCVRLLAIS